MGYIYIYILEAAVEFQASSEIISMHECNFGRFLTQNGALHSKRDDSGKSGVNFHGMRANVEWEVETTNLDPEGIYVSKLVETLTPL